MTTTQSAIAAAARNAAWEIRGESNKYAGYRKDGVSINIEWDARGRILVAVVDSDVLRGARKAERVLAAITR